MTDGTIVARLSSSPSLLDAARWVVESGLEDRAIEDLLAGLADRLAAAGIPGARIQIAFRLLHPLFDFLAVTWTRDAGAVASVGSHDDTEANRFEFTPYYRMISEGVREFRRRIEPSARQEFPILEELAASGATDYFAQLTLFGSREIDGRNGMASSWTTSVPEGFSEDAIAALRWIVRPLALAMKGYVKDQIARNALHTAGSRLRQRPASKIRRKGSICVGVAAARERCGHSARKWKRLLCRAGLGGRLRDMVALAAGHELIEDLTRGLGRRIPAGRVNLMAGIGEAGGRGNKGDREGKNHRGREAS